LKPSWQSQEQLTQDFPAILGICGFWLKADSQVSEAPITAEQKHPPYFSGTAEVHRDKTFT
jgi:hypothetical protein